MTRRWTPTSHLPQVNWTRPEQKLIWADMQRIYAEQLPVLPLSFRSEAHVTPTWLRGYVPTGQG